MTAEELFNLIPRINIDGKYFAFNRRMQIVERILMSYKLWDSDLDFFEKEIRALRRELGLNNPGEEKLETIFERGKSKQMELL